MISQLTLLFPKGFTSLFSRSQLSASRPHLLKYYLLIIGLSFWNLGFSQSFGTFASAVSIQTGTTTKFYNLSANPGSAIGSINFAGTNLGAFTKDSGGLTLKGAEIKTWKNSNANMCGGKVYYMVYPLGNKPTTPSFSSFALGFKDNCNGNSFPTGGPCSNGDQKWDNTTQNINLTNLCRGYYALEIYIEYNGSDTSSSACSTTKYVSNNGNNYIAYFSIDVPAPAVLNFSYDVAGNQIKRELITQPLTAPGIAIKWTDTNDTAPKTVAVPSYPLQITVTKTDENELFTQVKAQKSIDGINWQDIADNLNMTSINDVINENKTYYYRAAAYLCPQTAYYSNVLTITRNYNTPPTINIKWADNNTTTEKTCTTANCSFAININKADIDNDIQTQDIQKSTDGTNWASIGSTTAPNMPASFTDPLTANGTYYYRVVVKDAINTSYSNVLKIWRNYENCPIPKLLSVTRVSGTDNVTFVWENNVAFRSMSLQYSTDNGLTWSSSTGSPVSPQTTNVGYLASGKNILFRISRNTIGCSSAVSNIINYGIWTPVLNSWIGNALGRSYSTYCGTAISGSGNHLTVNLKMDRPTNLSTPEEYIGTQIYLPNDQPATVQNCIQYYSSGDLRVGVKYIRFYSFHTNIIFRVNELGKIEAYQTYSSNCMTPFSATPTLTKAEAPEKEKATAGQPLQDNFKQSLKVYPNPTSGVFSVEWDAVYNDNVTQVTITGYNTEFSKNIKYNQQTNKIDVNLSQEPPGIFYLTITLTDGSIVTEKVIRLISN